ncbi:MAG: hypothetical protein JW786_12315 [Desulfobacterales bacterium]|nr:hypothetical protein [Desulfobacterales bacterium]
MSNRNKKDIPKIFAREWSILLFSFLFTITCYPALLYLLVNASETYSLLEYYRRFFTIFKSGHEASFSQWIIAAAPYLSVQLIRLIRWIIQKA